MVTFPTPQSYTYSNFKGIRIRNGVNTGGAISAIVCQNVDFVPNTVGSDTQIKSTKGNVLVTQYPNYSIIKGFETVQDGQRYHLVYVETNGYSKEEFDLSKFTVVGSPTITDDGIASGFSDSNYLKINSLTLGNSLHNANSWKIIQEFTYNSREDWSTLFDCTGHRGISSFITPSLNNQFGYALSSDGTNEDISDSLPLSFWGLILGNTYKSVLEFTGTQYIHTLYNSDGTQFGETKTVTSSIKVVNSTNYYIGSRGDFTGSIYLKQFSITVDGKEVFKGTKTVEYPEKGMLLRYITYDNTFEVLIDNLLVTGKANGITMKDTAYDVFVFTNGKDYYSVNFSTTPITQVINPVYNKKKVTGLALAEKDGSLVIGQEDGFGIVIGSRQGDIYDWDYAVTADDKTKPWYQLFGKGVTAIVPYIGGLLVFTADDSTMLSGNPADLTSFEREDSSLGGCMSFESWCKHDKYLFFYDNTQKNIYYYTQIDTGQKILGEPIAPEVQQYFDDEVKRVQMTGFIGENRSEIWILSNKFKLIYDYFIGEWSERVCQDINSYYVADNAVYSTTPDGKILKEKEGAVSCVFDGVFYPAVYTMQTINLGSYSNMKEMEMQPLFTVSDDQDNIFVIDCLIDGKKTKTRRVQVIVNGAKWDLSKFDMSKFAKGSKSVTHQLKGKFVSNWYYIQFTVRTEEKGQEFNILAMELKGITMETDTIGKK